MLAKIYGDKMWFAFNQMRRVIPGDKKTSVLFELARHYISEQISKSNKGRRQSDEQKRNSSLRSSGMLGVKNKDDETDRLYISVDDIRYTSGDYIPINTGSSRSDETKELMKLNNGISGKILYSSPGLPNLYLEKDDKNIPPGYSLGHSDEYKQALSVAQSRLRWYNNKEIQIKIDPIVDIIPSGFVPGRLYGSESGLLSMNNPNNVTALNLLTGERGIITREEHRNSSHYILGASNSYYVLFDCYLFDSISTFNKVCVFGPEISTKSINNKFKAHFNTNEERMKFLIDFDGCTYPQFGVIIKMWCDYDVSDSNGKTIIRREDVGRFNSDTIRRAFEEKGKSV
jgi:hypothetical protein